MTTVERPIKQYTERKMKLLLDFKNILETQYLSIKSPAVRESIAQAHQDIVKECIDSGLLDEICGIRDMVKQKHSESE